MLKIYVYLNIWTFLGHFLYRRWEIYALKKNWPWQFYSGAPQTAESRDETWHCKWKLSKICPLNWNPYLLSVRLPDKSSTHSSTHSKIGEWRVFLWRKWKAWEERCLHIDVGDMFRKLKQYVMKKTCNMKELSDVEDMKNFNRMIGR